MKNLKKLWKPNKSQIFWWSLILRELQKRFANTVLKNSKAIWRWGRESVTWTSFRITDLKWTLGKKYTKPESEFFTPLCTAYLPAADFMEYMECFKKEGDLLIEGWAKSEISCSFLSISSPCRFLSRLFQLLCFCVVTVMLRICAESLWKMVDQVL